MGIYSKYIKEDCDETEFTVKNPGATAIANALANPETVNVYTDDEDCYVATSDLERYMDHSGTTDVDDAISDIARANNVEESSITLVYDRCEDYIMKSIMESSVVLEKAVESDSMSIKTAQEWYNEFIKASKSKAENIKEIDERIAVLKECVRKMEQQRKAPNTNNERIKYSLKSLIPFNAVYRLIKLHDVYTAKKSLLVLLFPVIAAPAAAVTLRWDRYDKMLERQIKQTKDAIDYLEYKRARLK